MAVARVARRPTAVRRHHGADAGALVAIAVGGFAGGLARYGVTSAFPTGSKAFPWPVLMVNTAGAFALAALLVLVTEVMPPTRYVRPALGTGFLGAFTTFSSVAAAADQLAAHGRAWLAAGYLGASVLLGVAAALAGFVAARALVAARRSGRWREG